MYLSNLKDGHLLVEWLFINPAICSCFWDPNEIQREETKAFSLCLSSFVSTLLMCSTSLNYIFKSSWFPEQQIFLSLSQYED